MRQKKVLSILGLLVVTLTMQPLHMVSAADARTLDDFSEPKNRGIDDFSKDQIKQVPLEVEVAGPKLEVSRTSTAISSSSYHLVGRVSDPLGVAFVLVNGKEAALDASGEFTSKVLLSIGTNQVDVKAVNVRGATTETKLTLTRLNQKIVYFDEEDNDSNELVIEGEFHALLIGIEDYSHDSLQQLSEPIDDAEALATALSRYSFKPQNINIVRNPTRAKIIKELDQLTKTLSEKDNLLVFYAGHGYWDEKLDQGYWLPSDASFGSREAWLGNDTIRGYIRGISSKHTLLISDACFSGGIFKTRSAFSDAPVSIRRLYKMNSRKAMTSGSLTEVPDQSVFVKYLVKQLSQNQEQFVTSATLFNSFRTAVINNSPLEQVPQYGSIREAGDEGGDFLFVLGK